MSEIGTDMGRFPTAGHLISWAGLCPRNDESAVKVLEQGLQAAQRNTWLDQALGGGDSWWNAILAQIRDAAVFIFAISDDSLKSKPCRSELDYAKALGIPIVPCAGWQSRKLSHRLDLRIAID